MPNNLKIDLKILNDIKTLDNEILLDMFELYLREGASPSSEPLIWLRRELLNRLDKK